jgi:hypothetical protein
LARYVTVGSVSQYLGGADSAARHDEAAARLPRAVQLRAWAARRNAPEQKG